MEQVLFSLIKLQFNSTFTVLGDCQICFWYANLSIKVTQLRFLSLFLALAISLLMRHQVLYIGIGSLTQVLVFRRTSLDGKERPEWFLERWPFFVLKVALPMVFVVVTFRWWQDVFITIRSYRICLYQAINTFLIRHVIASGHAFYFPAKIKALRCEWQPLFPAIRGHVFPFSNQYCVYFNCVTFSLRVIQAFTI